MTLDHIDDSAEYRYRGLLARLRDGRTARDGDFDELYPLRARAVSSAFWTPIAVARRAAELLVVDASSRVLDIGSGVGKFCIVGAAVTGARFTGVEHRESFVGIARETAVRLGVEGADFIHGRFETVDIAAYDGVYLFNPFAESLWGAEGHLDESVELSDQRFRDDVELAERLLASAKVGTRVVTYHGFGGDMPLCYRLGLREARASGSLELWVKTR
jgi:SAM-dependent methyltransferase